MGATRSPNQAKAARVARELMKSFDLGDLQGLISEHLNYPKDTERLYEAVDPRYFHLEKERFKLFRILESAVKTEEEKQVLNEYSDNWVEQCSIREMGWFYLGYAAALRFFGTLPEIKLIEGGRNGELKPVPLKSEFKL
jgi:hypothetical protein